jgi:SNF2 family DNA or RNA helicase
MGVDELSTSLGGDAKAKPVQFDDDSFAKPDDVEPLSEGSLRTEDDSTFDTADIAAELGFSPAPAPQSDLFPHQIAALSRCVSLEARRHSGRVCGGILCDEAGLGKTITALALIARTREPQHPRIPRGAKLRGLPGQPRFYDLESHQLNELKLLPRDRRRTLMSSDYDPKSGGLKGQRRS